MKFFISLGLLAFVFYSCKKDSVNPQTLMLLQNKWLMVQDSIHYPAFSSENSVYIGTPNDYYAFFQNDSVHMQFGTAGGGGNFYFTGSYYLKNNSYIYLRVNPSVFYTILTLTENSLVLSNPVSFTYVGGPTYTGIRITHFKR